MVDIDRRQVLAYRIAQHGLHRDTTDLAVLDLGIQDAGARSPRVAMAARLPVGTPLDDPALVTVWAFRGAPHLVRRNTLAELAGRLWPRSDADAIARLSGSGTVFRKAGIAGLTAVAKAAEAMHNVVDTEKTRGEVSTEITRKLPAEYSYDCTTCHATHIYGSLFQLVGLAAGIEVRNESRPTRLRPVDPRYPVPESTTGAEPLVSDYLRLHGPATLVNAAGFLDTTRKEAAAMWPDELVEVTVDGRPAFLPADAIPALRSAPDPNLVRLLPPLDPLLQLRDRELLVPDGKRRKELWRMIGNPGAVLAGGEIVGMWRTKASGRKLDLTVEPFEPLGSTKKAVEAEAQIVAHARGLDEARVAFG